MQYRDVVDQSVEGLQKLLHEQRTKLQELRFSVANKEHKNVRELRTVRQTIARLLTALQQKQTPPTHE